MNLYTTIQQLCATPSVSGRENGIRELLAQRVTPYADEIRVDNLGNLIAKKKGSGKGKSVMLCAHMDEIGFLVTFIEDSGLIRIAPVGGIHFAASAFSEVISESGVAGVLVPDGKVKPADYGAGNVSIDIGAKKLVLELLAKMNREQGMTIIMVSSELNELRSLCDRIAIVSDGKLTGIFAPEASDAEYGLAMSGVTEGGKV